MGKFLSEIQLYSEPKNYLFFSLFVRNPFLPAVKFFAGAFEAKSAFEAKKRSSNSKTYGHKLKHQKSKNINSKLVTAAAGLKCSKLAIRG